MGTSPSRAGGEELCAPIFVVGCARSGTTIMRLMLNCHSRIAIPEETWFFPALAQKKARILGEDGDWRSRAADAICSSDTFPSLGVNAAQVKAELGGLPGADWPSMVAAANRAFARAEGKARWGDKTPGYARRLPLIADLYPNAFVIHMLRDGRDAVLSMIEHGVGARSRDVNVAAEYWAAHVTEGRRNGRALFGSRYLEIRYEDLVLDPERHLREACATIGEKFEPAMLDPSSTAKQYVADREWHEQTKEPLSKARSQRWRREMAPRDVRLVELCAGSTLQELGYELSGEKPGLARVSRARFLLSKAWSSFGRRTRKRVRRALGALRPEGVPEAEGR